MTTPALDALAETADGTTATITGRITAVEPQVTGQGNPWAVITVSGADGAARVDVPPREYLRYEGLLEPGAPVTVTGPVSRYREPTLRATAIQAEDLKDYSDTRGLVPIPDTT